MRDDLLDAHASIDWAKSQLNVLAGRIEFWRQSTPYEIIEELYPQNGEKLYKLANVQRLTPIAHVEAGLIIHSLRSSLDMLANVLAERNGLRDPKGVQFPICRTEDAYRHGKHAGRKEISRLSAADQIIEDLQPWAGGHPHLFDLHTLDIVRKHRHLIGVHIHPVQMTVAPIDAAHGFDVRGGVIFSGVWKGFENDAIVGYTKIGAPKPDIQITLQVTLSEGRPFPTNLLTTEIDKMASATAAIIELFD